MTNREAHQHIRDALVVLIVRHAGIAADSIEPDKSIWERFPTSGTAEHPSVASFVDEVHSHFDVYLTEEEWEEPSLERLAQVIYANRANPGRSLADWHREWSETRKGARVTFVFVNLVLGPILLFSIDGSWSRRVWVTLGLLLFVNSIFAFLYWRTIDAFRANRERSSSSAKK